MNKAIYSLTFSLTIIAVSTLQAQNIGVGTNNPQQKLHVAGNMRVDAMAGSGSGIISLNNNGDFARVNFTGNANDILKGDGTFGTVPSGGLPQGTIVGSAIFPDSNLLKAGFSFFGEQSSPYSLYRQYAGGITDQYMMLPTYENGNPSANPAPQARTYASYVWTGTEMLVWGGLKITAAGGYSFLEDGAKYNPATDTWTNISKTNAPLRRGFASSVWTGTEMLIWGGTESSNESINATTFNYTNTGGRYNPATNSWSTISTVNAPAARTQAGAVWTGSLMVVFGGNSGNTILSSGGRYNPATNTWLTMSTANAPTAEFAQTRLFWDGAQNQVIVLGENNTGARYNPITNVWTAMASVPASYDKSCAVWVGNQLWVYAKNGKVYQYTSSTNTWSFVTPVGPVIPSDFDVINAVWTGFEIVFFGYAFDAQGKALYNQFCRYSVAGNSFSSDQCYYNHLVKEGSVLCNAGNMVIKWGGDNIQFESGIPHYTLYPEGLRYYTVGGSSFPATYFKISSGNLLYLYRKN